MKIYRKKNCKCDLEKKKLKMGKILIGIFMVLCTVLFPSGRVKAAAAGDVHAIVICGENLHKPKAKKIYSALKQNKLPGYKTSDKNIHFFSYDVTSSNKHTTEDEFMDAVDEAFSQSRSKDLNIIYYTGHGSKEGIPTYGTRKFLGLDTETDVKYKTLVSRLAKYKGKFVYMANTCHARAFYTRGVKSLKKGDNRFLCLSAVYQDTKSVTNIFTNRVLSGIGYGSFKSCPADDGDGMISAEDLYNYTCRKAVRDKPYIDGDGPGKAAVIFQFAYTEQEKASIEMDAGEDRQLEAKVYRDGGVSRNIQWKSDNKSVATVDSKGNVAALSEGTARITSFLVDSLGEVCAGSESVCTVEVTNNEDVSDELIGEWEGYYYGQQGKTSLLLDIISIDTDGKTEAVFEFSAHPDNPGIPSGSFYMEGTCHSSTGRLILEGTEWIEHPSGYLFWGIDANLQNDVIVANNGSRPKLYLKRIE